jgi:hypothetical protein
MNINLIIILWLDISFIYNLLTYKSIEEYNTYLVDNQININIIDYIKEVYKFVNINSFLYFVFIIKC